MTSRVLATPVISVLLLVVLLAPTVSFGALPSIVQCGGPDNPTGCTLCDLMQTAQNILNVGIFVAIFVSSLFFAWTGILYLTASANITKMETAKNLFGNVLIGLLLILAAWLIVDTILKILVDPGEVVAGTLKIGPWHEVCPNK